MIANPGIEKAPFGVSAEQVVPEGSGDIEVGVNCRTAELNEENLCGGIKGNAIEVRRLDCNPLVRDAVMSRDRPFATILIRGTIESATVDLR